MKLIVHGSTGMVGMGTLLEALGDSQVEKVLSVSRKPCGVTHPKLTELILPDLFDFARHEAALTGYDACIWSLGVSSVGLSTAEYERITVELTLTWAKALLRLNPEFSFCYCSAAGAGGPTGWAASRRKIEAALEVLPFRHVGCVRPAAIQPGPGVTSRFVSYRIALALFKPLLPMLVSALPSLATTSQRLGQAMLAVVRGTAGRYILESADINRLGRTS